MTGSQARLIAELAVRLRKERGYAFTQGASDEETKVVEALLVQIIAERAKCRTCSDMGTYLKETTRGGVFVTEYCSCKTGDDVRQSDERAKEDPALPAEKFL